MPEPGSVVVQQRGSHLHSRRWFPIQFLHLRLHSFLHARKPPAGTKKHIDQQNVECCIIVLVKRVEVASDGAAEKLGLCREECHISMRNRRGGGETMMAYHLVILVRRSSKLRDKVGMPEPGRLTTSEWDSAGFRAIRNDNRSPTPIRSPDVTWKLILRRTSGPSDKYRALRSSTRRSPLDG